jgi:hypothetical protein
LGNEKRLNFENIDTKKITRDKYIPLGIKYDNVPTKFIVPIETQNPKRSYLI